MGMTPSEAAAASRRTTADANQVSNAKAQDGTLSQYEGDLTQSPMYKKMYGQRVSDTTTAYNNARMKRSTQARMSGFGYTSPIANTDQATVGQLEASDLGKVGSETMQDLMPYQMQAASMRGQNISTYGAEGTAALNVQQQAEQARLARRNAMFSKIAGLGIMGASMIPGVGPAMSATMSAAGSGMMK